MTFAPGLIAVRTKMKRVLVFRVLGLSFPDTPERRVFGVVLNLYQNIHKPDTSYQSNPRL